MNLLEQFKSDLIKAMKEKNKVELNTLRSVKGAMQLEVINKKLEESDELLLDVINKQIKMRNDSIAEFERAKREDLVASYLEEVSILKRYMPSMLSEEELDAIIDEVIISEGAISIKDLGKVMKVLTPRVKNRCNLGEGTSKIKNKLNS